MELSAPPPSPWLIWQVIDSAFPVGGFAHSGGLEAAAQLGFVSDDASLAGFVDVSLTQAARLAVPFVAAAARRAADFDELSRRYDTLLVNDPANRASRALGAAVLAAGEAVLPDGPPAAARRATRANKAFVHFPVAFGLLAASVGLDDAGAADAFLFQAGRTLFSAAVRLGVVGPMAAQRMLADLGTRRPAWVETARRTDLATAVQTAPTLDLLQSLHDRLYSRLFNS